MSNINCTNGKAYDVRFVNQNLEIERDEDTTGLRRVFVFQDLSIGNLISGRKEVIFYSYDISPTEERINRKRHTYKDSESEFEAFISTEIWQNLREQIITDFLKKIEFTSPEGEG